MGVDPDAPFPIMNRPRVEPNDSSVLELCGEERRRLKRRPIGRDPDLVTVRLELQLDAPRLEPVVALMGFDRGAGAPLDAGSFGHGGEHRVHLVGLGTHVTAIVAEEGEDAQSPGLTSVPKTL